MPGSLNNAQTLAPATIKAWTTDTAFKAQLALSLIVFLELAGAITKRPKKTAETSKKKTKTLVATSRGSIETSKAWRDLNVGLPGSAIVSC